MIRDPAVAVQLTSRAQTVCSLETAVNGQRLKETLYRLHAGSPMRHCNRQRDDAESRQQCSRDNEAAAAPPREDADYSWHVPDIEHLETAQAEPWATGEATIEDDQDNEPYMVDIMSGPNKQKEQGIVTCEPEWAGSLLQEEATAIETSINMENDKMKQGDEQTRTMQEDRMEQDNESKQKGDSITIVDPL